MKKFAAISALVCLFALASCTTPEVKPDVPEPEPVDSTEVDTPPDDTPDYSAYQEKPILMWIDCHANFTKFLKDEDVAKYLDKIQACGCNGIVLDVKPCNGTSYFGSNLIPEETTYAGKTRTMSSYVDVFWEETRKRGMTMTVSNTVMTWGGDGSSYDIGAVAQYPWLKDKICVEYKTDGTLAPMKDLVFLNPADPEVKEFILGVIRDEFELIGDKMDNFIIDYCRYPDLYSDFSETSHRLFEEYLGETVENFPADIFTWNSNGSPVRGKYYREWWEWRSTIIRSYVEDIREIVKSYNPEIGFENWAASWWHNRYMVGQNWADPDKDFTSVYDWSTKTYYKTGYADLLDVFQLGAYLSKVYPITDNESISSAVSTGKKLINGRCKMYTSFCPDSKDYPLKDAVYYSLNKSDGVMIFDLSYVDRYNNLAYSKILAAVKDAKADGSAYIIPEE